MEFLLSSDLSNGLLKAMRAKAQASWPKLPFSSDPSTSVAIPRPPSSLFESKCQLTVLEAGRGHGLPSSFIVTKTPAQSGPTHPSAKGASAYLPPPAELLPYPTYPQERRPKYFTLENKDTSSALFALTAHPQRGGAPGYVSTGSSAL